MTLRLRNRFGELGISLYLRWLPHHHLDCQNETYTLDLSDCHLGGRGSDWGAGLFGLDLWLGLVSLQITLNLGMIWRRQVLLGLLLLALVVSQALALPTSPPGAPVRLQALPEALRPFRPASGPPPGYTEAVIASYYGPGCRGRMANGDLYDPNRMLAASLDLPLGSWALVCRQDLCATVEIVDKGPFPTPGDPRQGSRAIDLGEGPAHLLNMTRDGLAVVTIHPLPAVTFSLLR